MENICPEEGALTACGGHCGHCPTVIVPGIGQSQVFLLDKNGKRIPNKGSKKGINFPVDINMRHIISALALPFLRLMITREDKTFSDRASKVIAGIFLPNASGSDGKPLNSPEVAKYRKSVARCTEEERAFIYSTIPLTEASKEAGEDHLYYFAYNSFGNNLETAAELYDMIQFVKKETGHSKVNIVPISLGGTVAVSLLHFYPQLCDDLNKIVFIVPGLNGTKFYADIFGVNLNTDEDFYRSRIAGVKGLKGRLLKNILKRLPDGAIVCLLRKTVDEIRKTLLINSTVQWGSVPYEDYNTLTDNLLSGQTHAEIRRQTDLFHQAQGNAKTNILNFVKNGVKVFDIVDYNYPIHTFVSASKLFNGDGWVNIESASLGAVSGRINEPLPEGYTQRNTCCANPGHNHISPDGIVDASAGVLPETTFYFRNQNHELTAENDVIISLVCELLLRDDITDVHSRPDRFPQFNSARNTGSLRRDILPKAESVDKKSLSPADAAELQAAVDECKAMLEDTIVDNERCIHAEAGLKKILVKIGRKNSCKFLSSVHYSRPTNHYPRS